MKNPYTLRAGEDLPVSLTYEGRPLAGRPGRGDKPPESVGEDDGAHRQERPRDVPAAARWNVADQGRAHDSGACRRQRGLGQFLGIAHVRVERPGTGVAAK